MKTKLFFALICMLFALPVFAQVKCDYTANVDAHFLVKKLGTADGTDYVDILVVDDDRNLINGIVCQYRDGRLVAEMPYKNGKGDGFTRTYYDNGQLKYEVTYKGGLLEGNSRYYLDNGNFDKELLHIRGKVVSGKCSNGYRWTDAEIAKWNGSNSERDSVRGICK